MGAPDHVLDAIERREQTDPGEAFELFPANAEIVELFVTLATQWRHAPTGQPAGLDYAAIEPTARLVGIDLDPTTFAGLRLMEAAVLRELRKPRHHR